MLTEVVVRGRSVEEGNIADNSRNAADIVLWFTSLLVFNNLIPSSFLIYNIME